MLQFVRVPSWGFEWHSDARYYGRRWAAHVGPWLIFIWPASAAQMDAYHNEVEALIAARKAR